MSVRLLFALALAALPVGLSLPASVSAQTAEPGAKALASRLVELSFPTEIIRRDSVEACKANFRASFLRHPQTQTSPPGLSDAMADAGCAKFDEVLARLLPEIMENMATGYAASLTSAELGDAIAFYSTSAGTKLVASTRALATGGNLHDILDSAEISRFSAFARSSAGQKIEALKPRQSADMNAAMIRATSAAQPQITAAALAAGQSFMQAQQSKKP